MSVIGEKFWVTEEFIKNRTNVTQNVDAKDISYNISIAGDLYIEPILGNKFYNDLYDKFDQNTLNSDETILVDYLKMTLVYYAAYMTIPNVSYRLSNKGVRSQSGEFSSDAGLNIVEKLMTYVYQIAETNEQKLRAYLNDNKDLFPDWESKSNKDSVVKPDGQREDFNDGLTSI